MSIRVVKELLTGLAKLGQLRLARQDERADYACSIFWVASLGRGVQLSPASTRNTAGREDSFSRPFSIRITELSRLAATWKTGLNGGFGLIAITDLVCLESI